MSELGERAAAFYAAYEADALPAGHRALVHEAARMLDTLDRLALLAAGDMDTWISINTVDGDITLAINGVVAERRQQQIAFKQLMGEIRQLGLKQKAPTRLKDEANDDDDPGAVILKLQQRANRATG